MPWSWRRRGRGCMPRLPSAAVRTGGGAGPGAASASCIPESRQGRALPPCSWLEASSLPPSGSLLAPVPHRQRATSAAACARQTTATLRNSRFSVSARPSHRHSGNGTSRLTRYIPTSRGSCVSVSISNLTSADASVSAPRS